MVKYSRRATLVKVRLHLRRFIKLPSRKVDSVHVLGQEYSVYYLYSPLVIVFGITYNARQKIKGFTLVESVIAVAVFLLVSVALYQGYARLLETTRASRIKVAAIALANEQFEIAHNLPYADVGVQGGIPVGKILPTQTLVRDGITFTATTTIRNVDDPFDGVIGGAPNDLSPADYKLMEVDITCPLCRNFSPLSFTTQVAPKNLENASTNGALFIEVFDANGQPVSGANVHIENNQVGPPIVIDDVTNVDGKLQIVDAPPGFEAYEISVSKAGYSSEQTFPTGGVGNPNPTKPHATVAIQQVTQLSFAIDLESTLNVSSVTQACAALPSIDFSMTGSKLIGTVPDVFKYDANLVTNASGLTTVTNLEWDTYAIILTDAFYDLSGAIPLVPIAVNPNSTQDLKLVVSLKNPLSLVVNVKDTGTQLPLSGASVVLDTAGYQETLITGRGFLRQTDWQGGAGQVDFVDPLRYFSSNGNIETGAPTGELKLVKILDTYQSPGTLVSSTFDAGSASNFHQILWQPTDQPPDTGPDSVRFQFATNNDTTTWNFLGPNGTASTFYTLADNNINPIHNNDRYARYTVLLQTASSTLTPNIAEIAFTFTSSCVPPGQVLFDGLAAGDYTLTISKTGYQTFNDAFTIGANWEQREVMLVPQ